MEGALARALTATGPLALLGIFALALLLGAFHSLLPGHGKTLLAATHATGRTTLPSALRDAVLIGTMRVATAALIALTGSGIASFVTGGGRLAEARLGAAVGVVFVLLGLWLAWTAWRLPHASPMPSDRAGPRPVLLLGFVPDPVSLGVLIAATLAGAPLMGVVAALGLAFGMTLTLALFATGGVRARHLLDRAGALDARTDRWLRLAGGITVAGIGLMLVLSN